MFTNNGKELTEKNTTVILIETKYNNTTRNPNSLFLKPVGSDEIKTHSVRSIPKVSALNISVVDETKTKLNKK